MAYTNGNHFFHHPHDLPCETISVPKSGYDRLLRVAQDHANLKEALYTGGIDTQTLEVLINGTSIPRPNVGRYNPTATTSRLDIGIRVEQLKAAFSHNEPAARNDYYTTNGQEGDDLENFRSSCTQIGTLRITGISDLITYGDMTNVIRGGAIISISIYHKDRCAMVTMLSGAEDFLTHVKRHDLYVQSKRLEVSWASRKFQLTQHVERQVLNGATRNLCLRNGAQILTEQDIRQDMEHIHGLVIIDIVFHGYDIFIYTMCITRSSLAPACFLANLTRTLGLSILLTIVLVLCRFICL